MGVNTYMTRDEWNNAYPGDSDGLRAKYTKNSLLKYGCQIHLGKKKVTVTVVSGNLACVDEVIQHKIQYGQTTFSTIKKLCEQIGEQQQRIFQPCYQSLALTINPHLKSSGIMLVIESNSLPRLVFSNNNYKEYGYCYDHYVECVNQIFDILKLNPKVNDIETEEKDIAQLLWDAWSTPAKRDFIKGLSPEEYEAIKKGIKLEECFTRRD